MPPKRGPVFRIRWLRCSWLGLSCLIGIGISWAGFWCQSLVSATTYTVVGVMNKMLTVTVNVLIWEKHASPAGIFSLCVCLAGGTLYQQAPLRSPPAERSELDQARMFDEGSETDTVDRDEETASLKPRS